MLSRGELCGATPREAWSKPVDTLAIPRSEPPIAGMAGHTDMSSSNFSCIAEVQILDEAEPPDETRLVRLLCLINRHIKLIFRQMSTLLLSDDLSPLLLSTRSESSNIALATREALDTPVDRFVCKLDFAL